MANLNNVSIQSAIAANAAKESYDSISNLIDTNLKKLDADVFTAHDNPAGDDMTTILNAQKNAAEINARNAAGKIFQPGENFVNLTSGPGINLAQPLVETGGARNFVGALTHESLGDNGTPLANTNLINNANPLQEILHGADSHLVNNSASNYTYNENGNSQNGFGRDGFGRDGKDGMNGTDGHGADCGCGCHDHDHDGGHKHHGHVPQPWLPLPPHHHHHEPVPPHHHNPLPLPPLHHLPHLPHLPLPHDPHCDEPKLHLPELKLPNLLNVDVLGNLPFGFLHGHLGNPADPLINVVAGGNLLHGQDNNPSDYGRILDVVTNTNILNHQKDTPLLSNIDVGVLRGEHNAPLLEVGLNGDVLHNNENLLELNLGTEFWGKDGPMLGANVINLKDLPQEKLAAIAASIAEKAFNESSATLEEIKSNLEEALENSGPNPAQPLMQIGVALAALGATVVATPHAVIDSVINVANGDLSQLVNAAHNDLSNLAGTDLSSVLMGSNPAGIDLGSAVSSLQTTLSGVTGSTAGDIGNVSSTIMNDGGAIIGAAQYDTGAAVGAVSGNLGNVVDGLHGAVGTAIGEVNGAVGTANSNIGNTIGAITSQGSSIINGASGEIGNVTGALHNTVGSVANTLTNDVGNITGTLTGDVGNIVNAAHGDVGNIVGAVSGNLSNVTGALSGDAGNVVGSLSGTVGGVTSIVGNTAGQILHDVGGGNSTTGLGLTISGGASGVSVGGSDLAGVHLGGNGTDITLPVVAPISPNGSLPTLSISQSGSTGLGAGTTHSLSNLDPLSPFADHGTGSGMIADTGHAAIDNTHSILNNVTTITHDTTTSTDHHVVPLLHGHG